MEAKLDWENPETEEEEDIEEDWFQYDNYFLPDSARIKLFTPQV